MIIHTLKSPLTHRGAVSAVPVFAMAMLLIASSANAEAILLWQSDGTLPFELRGFTVGVLDIDLDNQGSKEVLAGAEFGEGGPDQHGRVYFLRGENGIVHSSVLGSPTGFRNRFSRVAVIGDVDMPPDGVADFAVGAPGVEAGAPLLTAGRVHLFSGASGAELWNVEGMIAEEGLGCWVAGIGDVNDDGKPDVLAGASALLTPTLPGRAVVLSGLNGMELLSVTDGEPDSWFGFAVAGTDDLDGDGKPDYIVGAPATDPGGVTDAGSVYVLSSNNGTTGSPIYRFDGTTVGAQLGFYVASADVDGDGVADIISGAPPYDLGTGFFDGPGFVKVWSGVTGMEILHLEEGIETDAFGVAVAGMGDLDGDGGSEILVGAHLASPGGVAFAGSAFVYSSTGIQLFRIDGTEVEDSLASSLAAGDLDGDGEPEVILGVPFATVGGVNFAGKVLAYALEDDDNLAAEIDTLPVVDSLCFTDEGVFTDTVPDPDGTDCVGQTSDVAGGTTTGHVELASASNLAVDNLPEPDGVELTALVDATVTAILDCFLDFPVSVGPPAGDSTTWTCTSLAGAADSANQGEVVAGPTPFGTRVRARLAASEEVEIVRAGGWQVATSTGLIAEMLTAAGPAVLTTTAQNAGSTVLYRDEHPELGFVAEVIAGSGVTFTGSDASTVTASAGDKVLIDPATGGVSLTTPAQDVVLLIAQLASLELPHGFERSLQAKLEGAIEALDRGRINAAAGKLGAFKNEVEAQRNKKLKEAEADLLSATANDVLQRLT